MLPFFMNPRVQIDLKDGFTKLAASNKDGLVINSLAHLCPSLFPF